MDSTQETMVYDGRNRMVSLNAVPVAYDPDNRRVFHVEGAPVVDFWLPNGEKLMTLLVQDAPYQGAGALQFAPHRKYFWFGGRMVGSKGPGTTQEWMQPDRLGSHARVYPYGEEITATTTSYKFATYQRGGGGLDYAMNRHYSPVYGRFTSADPLDDSASPTNSQSWNRFAYVQGDPISLLDPDGLGPINAQSCDDAKRMAQQAGGQAHFTCPTVSFSVTVTARPGGSAFNPGYQYGPGAMPGSIFDPHRPPVPTGPPPGTPTGGGTSTADSGPEQAGIVAIETAFDCLKDSVIDHFSSTVADGALTILGAPMPKEWLPPFRAIGNPNTSILSSVGHYLSISIPRVAHTANLLRAAGRVAGPLGAALLAWDIASITIETVDCYNKRQQH